jgi:hypothetical protein
MVPKTTVELRSETVPGVNVWAVLSDHMTPVKTSVGTKTGVVLVLVNVITVSAPTSAKVTEADNVPNDPVNVVCAPAEGPNETSAAIAAALKIPFLNVNVGITVFLPKTAGGPPRLTPQRK